MKLLKYSKSNGYKYNSRSWYYQKHIVCYQFDFLRASMASRSGHETILQPEHIMITAIMEQPAVLVE